MRPATSPAQAADKDGRLTWSPVNHIPHRHLTARSRFLVLTTANGTALTLSATHLVYVSQPGSPLWVPTSAEDVKARRCATILCVMKAVPVGMLRTATLECRRLGSQQQLKRPRSLVCNRYGCCGKCRGHLDIITCTRRAAADAAMLELPWPL